MTLQTIITLDPSNPVEVQTWLDAHPDITITEFVVSQNLFYILYQ